MRIPRYLLLACSVALAASLAACAGESTAPPISTDAVGPPSQMPQPANSLPLGAAVDAPVLSPQDALVTTRIGPSAATPTSSDPLSSPRAIPPRRSQ